MSRRLFYYILFTIDFPENNELFVLQLDSHRLFIRYCITDTHE